MNEDYAAQWNEGEPAGVLEDAVALAERKKRQDALAADSGEFASAFDATPDAELPKPRVKTQADKDAEQ
jgi:hypothetical protein